MTINAKKLADLVLSYLEKTGNSEILPELIAQLESVKKQGIAKDTVIVTSVAKLDQGELKNIENFVISKVGKRKIINQIDSQLIGGFTIRVDDFIYDTSIAGKINSIAKNLES